MFTVSYYYKFFYYTSTTSHFHQWLLFSFYIYTVHCIIHQQSYNTINFELSFGLYERKKENFVQKVKRFSVICTVTVCFRTWFASLFLIFYGILYFIFCEQGNVELETVSPSQLFPVGEEEGPGWNRPLLNPPDKYEFLQSPSVNKYSSFDPLNEDSLLW